jgi:hypothetical protein
MRVVEDERGGGVHTGCMVAVELLVTVLADKSCVCTHISALVT